MPLTSLSSLSLPLLSQFAASLSSSKSTSRELASYPQPKRLRLHRFLFAYPTSSASRSLESLEGLFEVGDHILGVLDTDREPQEVLPDSEPFSPRGRELAVRGGGWMDGEGVDVAQRRGLDAKLQRVEEVEGRLSTCGIEFEGDETPGVGEHAPGGRVVGVGLQRRMVDLRHLRVDGEAGRDGARVLALAAHPQGQRLEAAVREPGLEGTEHAPDELT